MASASEDLGILAQFREWLGESVDDKEFGDFMDTIMERRGHKRQSSWVDNEGDGKGSGGGKVLGLGQRKAAGGGGGWQYPG